MKRKTTLVYVMTMVIAMLLITSAAGISTMSQQPAIRNEENNVNIDFSRTAESEGENAVYPEVTTLKDNLKQLKLETNVVKKDVATFEVKKSKVEKENLLLEPTEINGEAVYMERSADQTRQPHDSFATHPAMADNGAGSIILGYDYSFKNYSAPPPDFDAFDAQIWDATTDYGETWSDGLLWVNDTDYPMGFTYPAAAYWGVNESTGLDQWFANMVSWDDPSTAEDDDGDVPIMRVRGDPTVNTSYSLRTWGFSALGFYNMKMTGIDSIDDIRFPTNTSGDWGEPFGYASYVMSGDSGINKASTFRPIEYYIGQNYPASGLGNNRYALMSTYTTTGACLSTDCAIDDETRIAYAVFDPRNATRLQYTLLADFSDNCDLLYEYYADGENPNLDGGGWTHWFNDSNLDLKHPAIAAYDGNVVIATEMHNKSNQNEVMLAFWYDDSFTGSVGMSLNISGVWYFDVPGGEKIEYPEVSHVYGDTFICTVIYNQTQLIAITEDGGATWDGFWQWSGDEDVIEEYRAIELSDEAALSVWEYDASAGGDSIINLYYSFNTVKVTGDCIDEFALPVDPDFIRIFNYDLDPISMIDPPYTGNTYTQTMLLGFDLWTNLTLRFVATSGDIQGSEFHNFSTIDHINVVDIIMDGIVADVDENCVVNVVDFLALLAQWGSYGPGGDIDFNGVVNVVDFLALLANWGNTC